MNWVRNDQNLHDCATTFAFATAEHSMVLLPTGISGGASAFHAILHPTTLIREAIGCPQETLPMAFAIFPIAIVDTAVWPLFISEEDM